MPQITLEYTDNIQIGFGFKDLFHQIHQILHEKAGISMGNCKSRALCLTDYLVGDGTGDNAFVHLSICIFEGRQQELKTDIGNALLRLLQQYFISEKASGMQITVEIQEIVKQSYFKFPAG